MRELALALLLAGCTDLKAAASAPDLGHAAPSQDLALRPDLAPEPDLGGLLAVTASEGAVTSSVSLSDEGVLDWANWGLNNERSVTRKNLPTSLIGDFVPAGPDPITHQYNNNAVKFLWDDGTPTAISTGTTNGIFIPAVGNGFRLSVAAGVSSRTLRLYIGSYAADFEVSARMSDGSAIPYTDQVLNSAQDSVYKAYTFEFRASTGGQSLEVTWIDTADHWGGANVTLQSATVW